MKEANKNKIMKGINYLSNAGNNHQSQKSRTRGNKIAFYFRQCLKALVVGLIFVWPTDIALFTGPLSITDTIIGKSKAAYFQELCDQRFWECFAGMAILFGLYIIFYRINWNYPKYLQSKINKYRAEIKLPQQEKLMKQLKAQSKIYKKSK